MPVAPVHYVDGMTPEQAQRAAALEVPVYVAVGLTIPALVLESVDPGGALGVRPDVLN